jgi:hypothetical protein
LPSLLSKNSVYGHVRLVRRQVRFKPINSLRGVVRERFPVTVGMRRQKSTLINEKVEAPSDTTNGVRVGVQMIHGCHQARRQEELVIR